MVAKADQVEVTGSGRRLQRVLESESGFCLLTLFKDSDNVLCVDLTSSFIENSTVSRPSSPKTINIKKRISSMCIQCWHRDGRVKRARVARRLRPRPLACSLNCFEPLYVNTCSTIPIIPYCSHSALIDQRNLIDHATMPKNPSPYLPTFILP